MGYVKSIIWATKTIFYVMLVSRASSLSSPYIYPLRAAEPVLNPLASLSAEGVQPVTVSALLDHPYHGSVNVSTEYIFVFNVANMSLDTALRVSVSSEDATLNLPLLFAVRQQRGILSWPVPLSLRRGNQELLYKEVSKTICPVQGSAHAPATSENVFLEVATASPKNVSFSLVLRQEQYTIRLGNATEFQVTPSAPRLARFSFPEGVSTALVRATSPDDICATISIQNLTCPIFDTQRDVVYGNQYQTMTLKAGITVRRENFPHGMFIVLVVHGDDTQCSRSYQHIDADRKKTVQLLVQEKISPVDYLAATMGALCFCGLFYFLSIVLSFIHFVKQRRQRQQLPDESPPPVANYGAISGDSSSSVTPADGTGGGVTRQREPQLPSGPTSPVSLQRADSDSSLSETELDMLPETDQDKNLFRTKTFLFVSDLARKNPRVLAKKSELYIWNLITIAVFYAVPVVQLVITYQKVLNVTGDQDICYYNFLCAHPLGVLSDFNHVYSNVGYVLLGLLFIGLVKRRDLIHQEHVKANDRYEQHYGIPRHFGLFYAMGAALMMEGILSACYHVCPSYSNFQFDTAFMYVIAVLCMLKIYQTRHPDINASAYVTYLVLSFIVFVGVIGVLEGTVYFWFGFIALHMTACLVLGAQIYYMGRWSIDSGVFRRIYQSIRTDLAASPTHCFRPAYPDRMALLVMAGLVNIALAVFGGVTVPKDFASYLVTIFITNLLLYTTFYIIMKLRSGEQVLLQPLLYIVLSCLSWGAAIYFFLQKSTTWQLSPAQSRTKNRDCEILSFYDDHDIWHFLSASSMFFGFMILLTLDDDLVFTRRDRIPVF